MRLSVRFPAFVRLGAWGVFAAIPAMPVFLFLAGASAAWAQSAVVPTAGDGLTTATAYQITQLGHLVWLRDQAAANATAGKYYKLMNDINAAATATWNDAGTTTKTLEGFPPIGAPGGSGWPFMGVFLGGDHAITGLYIHRPINGVGLFGGLGPGATVRNLRLLGGTITGGDQNVGGLAGYVFRGTILQCGNTGTVDAGGSNVGGLIGYNDNGTDQRGVSLVSQCWASGAVTGNIGSTSTDASAIGGLVGTNSGTISQSYASGTVTSGDDGVGGLVGNNYGGMVTQCHATGAVVGDEYVGGLCGGSSGTVTQSYATGTVAEGSGEGGGLVGRNIYGTIARCYATGAVTGGANGNGGLVGYNYAGSVSQSYATGAVTGPYSGGLVGANDGVISRCYATGAVSGVEFEGGLVGNGAAGVSESYWNVETSGLAASAGGMGLTSGTSLSQVINVASRGTPVLPLASAGYRFILWSDGRAEAPRTDAGLWADTPLTAIFLRANGIGRAWQQYR